MTFIYRTQGVCAREIAIEIENDKLVSAQFNGGCNGNLKGISELCKGMDIKEIIEKLEGIRCGFKSTSCPDQLAEALKLYIEKKEENNV